ncbi:MAG TPA: hypothetical protein VNV44_02760 [Solirubrobacteraceae bacterium]|nr:hypothetical protein [Solirubrobacteraceae bacterium]
MVVRADGTGGRLVIDRDLLDGGQRLLARLSADEPIENAALICAHYLEAPPERRRCRPPARHDELPASPSRGRPADTGDWSVTTDGSLHALRAVPCRMSIPELRWTRAGARGNGEPAPVSLRSAIALLESYEPFCTYTREAIARHDRDNALSTSVIRTELARVLRSPIVLNRGLREAVMARISCEEMTMSEIAIRCGRLKCDAKGNRSGETSWLARRIGLLPEGGQSAPTPWVHTDVLALIAREGLGIAPREVELG